MKRGVTLLISLLLAVFLSEAQHLPDTLAAGAASSQVAELLEGKVSGVRVSSSDGSMNGRQLVHIRGLNSLRSDSQPLWIVDGAIINQGSDLNHNAFYQSGGMTTSGDLLPDYTGRSYTSVTGCMGWLNLHDVESVEVLKDISATAVYGMKGANGVIVVKTRNGSGQAPSVRVSTNCGLTASYERGDAFRPGLVQDHHASVNGSTSSGVTYNTSLYLRHAAGPVAGESMLNGGLALNLETKTNKIFWFGLNANLNAGNSMYPAGTAAIGSASVMSLARNPETFTDENLQGWLSDHEDRSNDYRMTGSTYVRVNFLPSLSLNVTGGMDYYNTKRYIWYGNGTSFGKEFNGAAAILNTALLSANVSGSLDFDRYIASDHHVQATVAGEILLNEVKNNNMNGTDFDFHQLRSKGLSVSNSRNSIRKTYQNRELYTVRALLKYDYARYAGVSLSLNSDWNRHFEDTPVLLPAANAFLNLRKLFFADSGVIDRLDVTGGWGTAGYDYILPFDIAGDRGNSLPEIPVGIENYFDCRNRIISKEWTVGVESGFIDRIGLSVKYYDKVSEEVFSAYDFSRLVYGLYEEVPTGTVIYENSSILRNRGVEVDAQAVLVDRPSFRWTLYADASYNMAKITSGETGTANVLRFLGRTLPQVLAGAGTSVNVADFTIEARLSSAACYSVLDANKYAGQSFVEFTESDLKPADYLKLDRLSVSYDIPLSCKWIKRLNVCLTGRNLFVLSRYDGWNPTVNSFADRAFMYGVDYGSYPMVRSVVLGLNLLF